MSGVRYVRLDPTGNITCLVTEMPPGTDEREVIRRLMEQCEQVAFLEPARTPGALARIRLMGGEFCGNATMAAACFLASGGRSDRRGFGGRPESPPMIIPMEVSGVEGVLPCKVWAGENEYRGTVPMPRVLDILPCPAGSETWTAVRLEGILHLIRESDTPLEKAQAERLLLAQSASWPDAALGLLQWNAAEERMIPLVAVKGSNTLVWETGCGSGSAAIGAWRASRAGRGVTVTRVRQPGGVIEVSAEVRDGLPENLTITGEVRLGQEEELPPLDG